MKGKDLTKIAFAELSVGDVTWYPKDNLRGEKRGLITAKGNQTILVTEHYWDYLDDQIVEESLYVQSNETSKYMDNYRIIKNSEEKRSYEEKTKYLQTKGVKIKK